MDTQKTYTYEEANDILFEVMMDRGRSVGVMYDVMPLEEFDAMGMKAFWDYGYARVKDADMERGVPMTMAQWMLDSNGPAATIEWNELMAKSEDVVRLRMNGKCALVAAWETMGLPQSEVKHICDIICYGDYGVAEGLNLKVAFDCVSADGIHNYCDAVITKKDKD